MYLTVENINSLNRIISELNNIEDENKKEQFLNEHIEDTALFLETIRKINKKNLPKKNGKSQVQRAEDIIIEQEQYHEEDIYEILCQKSNIEMMNEYSLSELKKMYVSVYKRKPTSSYTKERIISTLRNRMHIMRRAEAFALLPAKEEKSEI